MERPWRASGYRAPPHGGEASGGAFSSASADDGGGSKHVREQLKKWQASSVSETSPPEPEEPVLRRQDTRLDHYIDRYAARAHGMTASAIRALFAVANRPEVVSLAGGMPNITDLPLDVVGSVLNELVLNDGRRAMQYGSGQGEPAIREAICDVMRTWRTSPPTQTM